jgi:hypothetical protein
VFAIGIMKLKCVIIHKMVSAISSPLSHKYFRFDWPLYYFKTAIKQATSKKFLLQLPENLQQTAARVLTQLQLL